MVKASFSMPACFPVRIEKRPHLRRIFCHRAHPRWILITR
jgi:hypothetical protein